MFFQYDLSLCCQQVVGTSEGQGGGAAFSKGTFNTVRTVFTTNIIDIWSNNLTLHLNLTLNTRRSKLSIK